MSSHRVSHRVLNHRIAVRVGAAVLSPILTVPAEPRGLVVVPSASGDRTYERVNRSVASALWEARFATVEVDLLTAAEAKEDADRSTFRYDLDLIASRLAAILEWGTGLSTLRSLEVGVFAGGTCSAAVLVAAAERPELIQSVALRSARPELATGALPYVHAPVLLLIGECDIAHRDDHAAAMTLLPPRSRLEVVANGRHLLDRPDDVRQVAAATTRWFDETLTSRWAAVRGG